jgi:hypothetical protein|tara:strand:- start:313 stop:507 length:195 start_codon:yes stop_codon:yes gene_type:complete
MEKTIRSISIMESLDNDLKEDSEIRGLTISANVSRILYEYFQMNSIGLIKKRKKLNLLSTTKQK